MATLAVAALASPAAHAGTAWSPWGEFDYSLDDAGHLRCASMNGIDCLPTRTAAAIDTSTYQPVSCGPRMRARLGHGGYETPGHWCNQVYAARYAAWEDQTMMGHALTLATTPDGDTMCRSRDGGLSCASTTSDAPVGSVATALVCGAMLQSVSGVTGYGDPTHWCRAPRIALQVASPPLDVLFETPYLVQRRTADAIRVPPWRASDQPGWIIWATIPQGSALGLAFQAKVAGDARKSQNFILDSLGKGRLTVGGSWAAPMPPLVGDAEGRVTMALAVTTDGAAHVYAAPGWVPWQQLRSRHELAATAVTGAPRVQESDSGGGKAGAPGYSLINAWSRPSMPDSAAVRIERVVAFRERAVPDTR